MLFSFGFAMLYYNPTPNDGIGKEMALLWWLFMAADGCEMN